MAGLFLRIGFPADRGNRQSTHFQALFSSTYRLSAAASPHRRIKCKSCTSICTSNMGVILAKLRFIQKVIAD